MLARGRKRGVLVTILLFLLLLLLGVLIARTVFFTVQKNPIEAPTEISVPEQAVDRLSQAIRFATISDLPETLHRADFLAFHRFLRESFPLLHASLDLTPVNDLGLLYCWKGANPNLKPVLLIAHQDVVPVEEGTEHNWNHLPFSGEVADGYIWGRGTWDDKSALMASLEAVEMLLREGKRPERALYLALGQDEEVGGTQGGEAMAQLLQEQGVEFEFVLDEGGVIGLGLIPGVEEPVALVATAEKGYLTLRLTAKAAGGHSSMPAQVTAIGRLSRAIDRLQGNPFSARMTEPVRDMLMTVGPHMVWKNRLLLANLWLFEPLALKILAGGDKTQAHVRTTVAPTMLEAGTKENILPQSATAIINLRLLPGDSIAGVISQVKRTINDDLVELEELVHFSHEPSEISHQSAYGFQAVKKAIQQVERGMLVSPLLLFGATDSRHYAGLTDTILRYTPIRIANSDMSRIHGTNERIAIKDYQNGIRFYYQLITNTVVKPDTQLGGSP